MRVIVLGAGPAGLSAAAEVLRAGHALLVVDPAAPGGHALHNSLVPSKIWIEVARASAAGHHDAAPHLVRLRRRAEVIAAKATALLRHATVVPASGRPVLINDQPAAALSDGRTLTGDRLIIAVGSVQRPIPGLTPDGRHVLIPRHLAQLSEPPETLTVIGAGPTGLEVAVLFRRLGTRVTLVTPDERLLPGWNDAIAARLTRWMSDLGIDVKTKTWIVSGRFDATGSVLLTDVSGAVLLAEQVFLATGRVPVAFDPWPPFLSRTPDGFIAADAVGRTSHPAVFAAGDCTGPPLLAGRARHQGRAAARVALGELPPAVPPTPEVIYTHPDVGRIPAPPEAQAACWVAEPGPLAFRVWLEDDAFPDPYLAVYTDRAGHVIGAEGIGPGLADVLAVVEAAVVGRLRIDQLVRLPFPSPTVAEWLEDLAPAVSATAAQCVRRRHATSRQTATWEWDGG